MRERAREHGASDVVCIARSALFGAPHSVANIYSNYTTVATIKRGSYRPSSTVPGMYMSRMFVARASSRPVVRCARFPFAN